MKITSNYNPDPKKVIENLLKTPLHSKILGIVYVHEPLSLKDVLENYQRIFQVPLNKGVLSDILNKLTTFNILKMERASEIGSETIHQKIKSKHYIFIKKLPHNLSNAMHIRNMVYYYVSDVGKEYIEVAETKGEFKIKK